MQLNELKKIIPFKWKIQTYIKGNPSAICCCYVDARDCMDLLDEIVGPQNWQVEYKEIKSNLFAGVGIWDETKQIFVWKWDVGTEAMSEKEKSEASDSFKRACVRWGIGRFLYQIPAQFVKLNGFKSDSNPFPFPVDETGNKISSLSDYFNNNKKIKGIINKLKQVHNVTNLPENKYYEEEGELTIDELAEKEINQAINKDDLKTAYKKYYNQVLDKEGFKQKVEIKKGRFS